MKNFYLFILTFYFGSTGINSLSIASEIRQPYKKLKDSTLYINKTCFRIKNKEEYIPGTYLSPGYVRYWKEYVGIKCPNRVEGGNCFVLKYNEEYIPGNNNYSGYVKSWNQEVRVPCNRQNNKELPQELIKKSRIN